MQRSSKKTNDSRTIVIAVISAFALIGGAYYLKAWLDGLTPLLRGLAVVGILAAVAFVFATIIGFKQSTAPVGSRKSMVQAKAEVQLTTKIAGLSLVVAGICFFGFLLVQRNQPEINKVNDVLNIQRQQR